MPEVGNILHLLLDYKCGRETETKTKTNTNTNEIKQNKQKEKVGKY